MLANALADPFCPALKLGQGGPIVSPTDGLRYSPGAVTSMNFSIVYEGRPQHNATIAGRNGPMTISFILAEKSSFGNM